MVINVQDVEASEESTIANIVPLEDCSSTVGTANSLGGLGHQETQTQTAHLRTRPLSARQERRLVEYVDDKILDLTRNFKKRYVKHILIRCFPHLTFVLPHKHKHITT